MASNLRRLASDHASLHSKGLPPHYLFPPSNASSLFPDDLTQLTILLTGPQGTPYSQGLWQLHLRMPEDYPKSPPKAAFKTRIWHPNVDEESGAVCVDTLKRGWEPKLTLRDVLVTISCLLIHPNPDSALNSSAGGLLQDDYEAFARQAKLMTSIHAPIPKDMRDAVMEAKRRGDDSGAAVLDEEDRLPIGSRKVSTNLSSVVMKKPVQKNPEGRRIEKLDIRVKENPRNGSSSSSSQQANEEESDTEDAGSASKENDPSLSPSPVCILPPSSRESVLGKRPLSVLSTPSEPEMVLVNDDDAGDDDGMTASERNIAANTPQMQVCEQPQRKSPKLSELSKGVNASGRLREGSSDRRLGSKTPDPRDGNPGQDHEIQIYDESSRQSSLLLGSSNEKRSDEKENVVGSPTMPFSAAVSMRGSKEQAVKHRVPSMTENSGSSGSPASKAKPVVSIGATTMKPFSNPTARKVSSSAAKSKPRVGLRRL
ncbi:hypothetical protein FQN52_001244 [Onygenales sp. PD_12]|nr:hypothetical protein FQN52_001244 [Onygenales sp. PD_12]